MSNQIRLREGQEALTYLQALPLGFGRIRLEDVIYEDVYKAVLLDKNQVVAIKARHVKEYDTDAYEAIAAELAVFEAVSHHDNILGFSGAFRVSSIEDLQSGTEPNNMSDSRFVVLLAMEYCQGGSIYDLARHLRHHLSSHDLSPIDDAARNIKENTIAYIIKSVAQGLQFLHSKHVMHRDIKGGNILLTDKGDVRLMDFDTASVFVPNRPRQHFSSVGTPYWMSPEMAACDFPDGYSYDERIDIWSLAITAIEMAEGQPPLYDTTPARAAEAVLSSKPPTLQESDSWSKDFNGFLEFCLIKDHEKRPKIEQVLNHSWLKKVDVKIAKDDLLSNPHFTRDANVTLTMTKSSENFMNNIGMDPKGVHINTDNLAVATELSEEWINDTLLERHNDDVIYTYVGDMLIAVNPFHTLHIYNSATASCYTKSEELSSRPHIYALAFNAYHSMVHEDLDQSCVISGESGAGKTETAKYFTKHLLFLSGQSDAKLSKRYDMIQYVVNDLLEAFGNAATTANKNSSRFGKYVEFLFDRSNFIIGAQVSQYLHEKSRVAQQAENEQNFHVFYYLLAGLNESEKKQLNLTSNFDDYNYLNGGVTPYIRDTEGKQGKPTPLDRSFEKMYQQLFLGMADAGFRRNEIMSVKNVLATVLHLGNVDFVQAQDAHYFNLDINGPIDVIADLLATEEDDLSSTLTSTLIVTRGETIIKPHTVQSARDARDAVSKALYGRLFSWLVNKLNTSLAPALMEDVVHSIGVLDIFGFEALERNGLEQLCINVANEQLQYFFNLHVFQWQKRDLQEEGINAKFVSFHDNSEVLHLFMDMPIGLFSLLDEESHFPAATDLSLCTKLHAHFADSYRYVKPTRTQHPSFGICHYAGIIQYEVHGWLEKNRDHLSPSVVNFLRECGNPLVRSVFSISQTETGGLRPDETPKNLQRRQHQARDFSRAFRNARNSMDRDLVEKTATTRVLEVMPSLPLSNTARSRQFSTVAGYFRASLETLMNKLSTTNPHFVRCIKPNPQQQPGHYEKDFVLKQLKYSGVLETVRIRRDGYALQLTFSEFLARYQVIHYSMAENVKANAASCRTILSHVNCQTGDWQIGHRKVFLKYNVVTKLRLLLEHIHLLGNKIVRQARVFLARVRMKRAVRERKEREEEERRKAEEARLLKLKQEEEERERQRQAQLELERQQQEEEARRKAQEEEERKKAEEAKRKAEEEARLQAQAIAAASMMTDEPMEDNDPTEMVDPDASMHHRLHVPHIGSGPANIGFPLEEREFESIPNNLASMSDLPPNCLPLCRYKNVLPTAATRVKLRPLTDQGGNIIPGSDFINANYVRDVHGKNRYIATQGPKPNCVDHFWRMVWETKSKLIVMATNLREAGRPKCHRYWPEYDGASGNESAPNIITTNLCGMQVFTEEVETCDDYVLTRIRLQLHNREHFVTHFHLTNWPDYGVPKSGRALLDSLDRLRPIAQSSMQPIIVHCSAGVGRTGMVIAVDQGIEQLREHQRINLTGYIRQMREDRGAMLQTYPQYEFVYKALGSYARRLATLQSLEDDSYSTYAAFIPPSIQERKDGMFDEKIGQGDSQAIAQRLVEFVAIEDGEDLSVFQGFHPFEPGWLFNDDIYRHPSDSWAKLYFLEKEVATAQHDIDSFIMSIKGTGSDDVPNCWVIPDEPQQVSDDSELPPRSDKTTLLLQKLSPKIELILDPREGDVYVKNNTSLELRVRSPNFKMLVGIPGFPLYNAKRIHKLAPNTEVCLFNVRILRREMAIMYKEGITQSQLKNALSLCQAEILLDPYHAAPGCIRVHFNAAACEVARAFDRAKTGNTSIREKLGDQWNVLNDILGTKALSRTSSPIHEDMPEGSEGFRLVAPLGTEELYAPAKWLDEEEEEIVDLNNRLPEVPPRNFTTPSVSESPERVPDASQQLGIRKDSVSQPVPSYNPQVQEPLETLNEGSSEEDDEDTLGELPEFEREDSKDIRKGTVSDLTAAFTNLETERESSLSGNQAMFIAIKANEKVAAPVQVTRRNSKAAILQSRISERPKPQARPGYKFANEMKGPEAPKILRMKRPPREKKRDTSDNDHPYSIFGCSECPGRKCNEGFAPNFFRANRCANCTHQHYLAGDEPEPEPEPEPAHQVLIEDVESSADESAVQSTEDLPGTVQVDDADDDDDKVEIETAPTRDGNDADSEDSDDDEDEDEDDEEWGVHTIMKQNSYAQAIQMSASQDDKTLLFDPPIEEQDDDDTSNQPSKDNKKVAFVDLAEPENRTRSSSPEPKSNTAKPGMIRRLLTLNKKQKKNGLNLDDILKEEEMDRKKSTIKKKSSKESVFDEDDEEEDSDSDSDIDEGEMAKFMEQMEAMRKKREFEEQARRRELQEQARQQRIEEQKLRRIELQKIEKQKEEEQKRLEAERETYVAETEGRLAEMTFNFSWN